MQHNLCPFARPVRDAIRTVVCDGDEAVTTQVLSTELQHLRAVDSSSEATTLIILTGATFASFESLMSYLPDAQALADATQAGEDDAVQLLPFHPDASYSEDGVHDPADFSTRSPLPLLHLLREADVAKAEEAWVAGAEGANTIQERNAAYLRGLGYERARALLAQIQGRP